MVLLCEFVLSNAIPQFTQNLGLSKGIALQKFYCNCPGVNDELVIQKGAKLVLIFP
jgi:hypothetical protein